MKCLVKIFPGLLLFILCLNSLYAQLVDVDVTPPSITITSIDGTDIQVDHAINTALNGRLNNAAAALENEAAAAFAKYGSQEKLAKGFANANVYASRPATLQGYQDYRIFALAAGVMVGIQAPAFHIDQETVKNVRWDIYNDGDVYLGFSTGIALVNAGINIGFLIPGLYLNLTYGVFSFNGKEYNPELEGFLYETSLYSVGINYNIVWSRTIIPGLVKWRGISIGTGFSYAGTKSTVELTYAPLSENFTATDTTSGYSVSGSISMNPMLGLTVQTKNMTIPLDISTSIKLLYVLNFNLGIGADFNYGFSDISLDATSDVNVAINTTGVVTSTPVPGSVTVHTATEDVKASMINPRVTAGIGFNFSVVKIDIPVAVYLDAGFSAGVSAGIVW